MSFSLKLYIRLVKREITLVKRVILESKSEKCKLYIWFVSWLRFVYPILQVSLYCPLLIAPSVFSNICFLLELYIPHSVHQNSVESFESRYIGDDFLGSNLVSFNRTLVISPPPYCTRVSKDAGSSSCERKISRPSVYIFFSIFLT